MVLRGAQNTFGCWRLAVSRHAASNKSLDVRRKQRLCYRSCPFTFGELGGGFRPRHLRRWARHGENQLSFACKEKTFVLICNL